jgi:glycosyltransferase involved in cell wall biosynthesis
MNDSPRATIALGCEYPLAMRGGVSVLVEELIRGLSKKYRVVLVSPDRREDVQGRPIDVHVRWEPDAVTPATSRALADQLAAFGTRLVHLHSGGNFGWGSRIPGQSPIPFLARRGILCLSTIHMVVSILDGYCGPQKPLWFKLVLLPLAWLGKLHTLKNLRTEITVSCGGLEKVRRWYWPFRGKFLCIYHSRIRDSDTVPLPANERQSIIINVGHIAFRKGQHVLAEAFVKIAHDFPEWKLLLAGHCGDEACWKQIEQIGARANLGDRIQLLGSRDDTFNFLKRAAIFAQPSLFEGLPLALQEAMFHGCACIATSVAGNVELIENESNGLLVPHSRPAAMADGLARLMRSASLRERFSVRAHQDILDRGMIAPRMVEQYIELYEKILSSKSEKLSGQ